MSRPAPSGPPGTARTLLLAALLGAAGCGSARAREAPEPGPGEPERPAVDEQAGDVLAELLEDAPLEPVEEFDEEEYYSELAELYGAAAEGGDEAAAEAVQQLGAEPQLSPYQEFGSRILVYRDSGFVMKRFAFPTGMGAKAQRLIEAHGGFKVHASFTDWSELPEPGAAQPDDAIVLHLVNGGEMEAFSAPRGPNLATPAATKLGDWLIVVAKPAELRRVEAFIDTFLADVRQIEIEAKIVEVVTTDSFDYGIRPIDDTTPIFGLPNPGTFVNGIDFSFGNTVDTAEAIFGVHAVFDGVEFNALLEMVAREENVSIISRPKVAVREGARADIVNVEQIPYPEIKTIADNGTFTTNLTFKEVGVQMYIVPRIVGSGTVILNIDIEASQQTGTAVTFVQGTGDDASVVLVPEISQRRTHTTVRLEPGEAVILGGLITQRKLERERKVPFFGDIPLLGYLFKSRFTENQQVNVLFFIRPRILQGMDLNPDF